MLPLILFHLWLSTSLIHKTMWSSLCKNQCVWFQIVFSFTIWVVHKGSQKHVGFGAKVPGLVPGHTLVSVSPVVYMGWQWRTTQACALRGLLHLNAETELGSSEVKMCKLSGPLWNHQVTPWNSYQSLVGLLCVITYFCFIEHFISKHLTHTKKCP